MVSAVFRMYDVQNTGYPYGKEINRVVWGMGQLTNVMFYPAISAQF
jgi:hypothetical protein